MTKEQFIEIIKGFDIKEIEEYKIKYKDSENHSAIIQLGFDEEDNNDVNVANTIIFDLQDRIDKAIEYLESYNRDFKHCKFGEAPISMRELGDLLDILKGSDKE